MVTITGTIEKKDIGIGTWTLVSDEGSVYELANLPSKLKQNGLNVSISGKIQEDTMTIAMVGPVLAVESYELL